MPKLTKFGDEVAHLPHVAFTWHEFTAATQALPPLHKPEAMPGSVTPRQRDAIRARQVGNRISGYVTRADIRRTFRAGPCWFCAHPATDADRASRAGHDGWARKAQAQHGSQRSTEAKAATRRAIEGVPAGAVVRPRASGQGADTSVA